MKRVIDERGYEYIEKVEDRSVRHDVEPVKLASRPSIKLLDEQPDGTWILMGNQTYRRDLDAWIVGKVHPDVSKRFNTVEQDWMVDTHRRDAVYRLDVKV